MLLFFGFFDVQKPRTYFGEKLDEEGITQLELEKASGLSRGTISRLCNDEEYQPKLSTEMKVKKALKKLGVKKPGKFFE
ncbi:helix-turn-helix domain-containing protein [Bacillus piscicola]|uniref:helix-turn-helix domain-containing protein n=1 Tax=Bacillus piscicola TaxID=1632684 RepID=UPI001F0895EB|nr:helix-turn-helix transcriptional regulator [Bacillus piscicola]